MTTEDFTNHSGGALGSDKGWDVIGREHGFNNHIHYYHGKKTAIGNRPLTEEECDEGWDHVLQANLVLRRQPYNYRSLLSRNWFQVKMSTAIYAISTIRDNIVNGGTGWAVQMAIDAGKDVYVFDQDMNMWFTWNKEKLCFETCEVPVLSVNYAGIGTRDLNINGYQAIEDVYLNTLKQIKNED